MIAAGTAVAKWSARDLFARTTRDSIVLSAEDRTYFEEFLFHDFCAESDSRHLYEELQRRRLRYSRELLQYLAKWYVDEQNHAQGFLRIYAILFGTPEEELVAKHARSAPDFSGLAELFDDEFQLAVLFAYDEYASVMTYRKDRFYERFGPPEFMEWIRRLRSDEARHFAGAVKIVRRRHAHRVRETRAVLERILAVEAKLTTYQSTFLLDHPCPHFLVSKQELETICVDTVERAITAGLT